MSLSPTPKRFVCAFYGRRDSYQLPLALHEVDKLDQLIMDAYGKAWARNLAALGPRRLKDTLRFRQEPGLPERKVRCLWGATVYEQVMHSLRRPAATTYPPP